MTEHHGSDAPEPSSSADNAARRQAPGFRIVGITLVALLPVLFTAATLLGAHILDEHRRSPSAMS